MDSPLNYGFETLFSVAMGRQVPPYPYQSHLAKSPWPDILKVETGMGKTACIILTWLFKRLINDPGTPHRLVYCLPMRSLVEQTASNANQWVRKLVEEKIIRKNWEPSVHVLMGGEIDGKPFS